MSVTVITGGAGGIARACAERLRERGPVLTADIAGADVVCDVTDAASVAALAQRAAELGPLGAASRTIVERDFVWTRLVDRHIELYEELLASTSRRGSRGAGGR